MLVEQLNVIKKKKKTFVYCQQVRCSNRRIKSKDKYSIANLL